MLKRKTAIFWDYIYLCNYAFGICGRYLQTVTTTWMCQIARLMIPVVNKFALLIPLLVVKREKNIGGTFVFVIQNT
jgi:hypothetical protein